MKQLLFTLVLSLGLSAPLGMAQSAQAGTPPASVELAFDRDSFSLEFSRLLTTQFAVEEGELAVETLSSLPREFQGLVGWSVELVQAPAAPSTYSQVRVRLHGPGRASVEFPMNVRMQHWQDVWVAKDAVSRGDAFNPASLELRRVDVLRERNVVSASKVNADLVFRNALPPGRLVRWQDLERRALVHRGDLVEVVASDGMLVVKMKALALEDGAEGDTIQLRNLQSKRNISALVVAENQARVTF